MGSAADDGSADQRKDEAMALFMDTHTIDGGVSAAPDAEAANTVHRDAHGLVADEIYTVTEHA